jgi:hypothetical protein
MPKQWDGVTRREIDKAISKLSKRLGNPAIITSRHGIDYGLIEYTIEVINKLEQKIEILEGI